MILHVVDQDGTDLYVTELNAVDAATGQARVIFVDPQSGKTYVHLYSDFFQVIPEENEDALETEKPRYEVKGVVDTLPSMNASNSEKNMKKKSSDRSSIKTKPVRTVVTITDDGSQSMGASARDESTGDGEDHRESSPSTPWSKDSENTIQ